MLKNISNKIKVTALAALVLGASSCNVTDLSPANVIPEDEAFSNPTRVEALALGVYEAAQRGFYLGAVQRGYPFGAASTQQGDMRGEDMYNDQLFYEITYVNAHNPNSANNNGQWISLYRMINRANIVLEGLDGAQSGGVLNQEQRDTYRGEMLFMRALAHHELLLYFCRPYVDGANSNMGVPYRTFAVNDVQKVEEAERVPRGTVAEAYQLLLTDLNEAENLLTTMANPFRARKGAVLALKMRVKMHMGDWAGVLTEYAKLTGYALTDNVVAPFRGGTSTDNIFSFQNTAASNPGVNGALGTMYGNPANGARGLVKISPLIWRADWWHPEDERRDVTTRNAQGIYTDKYIDPVNFSDPSIILRYAECVLMAAEAHARTGNLPQAVTLLNSVRDRALPETVPSFTLADLGGNLDGVLDAIIKERRIEFLAEGRRWPDIHRLSGEGRMAGIPAKATSRSITNLDFYTTDRTIPTDHSLAYSSDLFVWPIPLEEILNNTTAPLTQNPGY